MSRTRRTSTIGTRIGRAAFVAATAIGLTAGLTATASAAPISLANLTIDQRQCPSSQKEVHVSGVASMSQADAQRFIDYPGDEVEMKIWGADASYHDQLYGPVTPKSYSTTASGLHFVWYGCVANSTLNEDWGQDEVFVKITLHDFRDGSVTNRNTNQVWRSF